MVDANVLIFLEKYPFRAKLLPKYWAASEQPYSQLPQHPQLAMCSFKLFQLSIRFYFVKLEKNVNFALSSIEERKTWLTALP